MRFTALLIVLLARVTAAQTTPRGAVVSGVVRDSIARMPLANAHVQLVHAEDASRFARAGTSDSLGRFRIDSVPDGRYTIGFFHAVLDSLAIEPVLKQVVVRDGLPVVADLATPSPARLRAAFCDATHMDSAGVVVGIVRDARDRSAAPGIVVLAEWLDVTLSGRVISNSVARTSTTTRDSGWFVLCGVPNSGTLALSAHGGRDTVDRVDVSIPVGGFVRRDLFLGAARVVARASAADSAFPRTRVLAGDGTLRGTVVNAKGSQPVSGASVRIVGGPETRTNTLGEWTLSDVPLGTRTLEVRAIGFLPDRRAVDVVTDAPPVAVVMATVQAMLDTVRVTSLRREARDLKEFEERRQMSAGTFFTAEDVARRRPFATTDLFRMTTGMRVERTSTGTEAVFIRGGLLSVGGWCTPSVWLDGMYIGDNLLADDINALVAPADVIGIEVYPGISTPARFQRGVSNCGALAIWTNLRSRPRRALSWRALIRGVGVAGAFIVAGVLLMRT